VAADVVFVVPWDEDDAVVFVVPWDEDDAVVFVVVEVVSADEVVYVLVFEVLVLDLVV
jgi:hypothetical protein